MKSGYKILWTDKTLSELEKTIEYLEIKFLRITGENSTFLLCIILVRIMKHKGRQNISLWLKASIVTELCVEVFHHSLLYWQAGY